ncbi:hypothetical protein COV82_01300 [Candidatus Peregrinibacteria bacterium CG11_big_fil_rev_8_21_14_0_20_46_8]|nr:MAG: hypothetical protein COV82_01300 [Candidatus Peregrinibacteria bacterium CG11_big_fil_rev_8_21_14_0_20_46_8]
MVSCFSPNSQLHIICPSCWWSDDFDPLLSGRDFDFSRPFFEQFWELMHATPIGALFIASSENSEYSNFAVNNKDCYMVTASDNNQDTLYADNSNGNSDSCDISFVHKGELNYDCVDLVGCYSCIGSQNLKNSNFCRYSRDLINCSDCIGCVGLRNKQYCILNRQFTKEQFEKAKEKMELQTHTGVARLMAHMYALEKKQPHKFSQNINAESCTGNYIVNSKDCRECFDMENCQDCTYSIFGDRTKDAYDIYGAPGSELVYQSVAIVESYNMQFDCLAWPGSNDVSYSFLTRGAKNSFGCVSLKKNTYCILNKQYSKEEYEKLRTRIVEHMERTGEYGQFFPLKYSPWSYNETIAQDYAPKTKEQVAALGGRWEDNLPGTFGKQTLSNIPDNITEVAASITKEILACTECERNFKVISQELKFYKQQGIPLPIKCPTCRYRARLAQRNQRQLIERQCMNEPCQNRFQTTYTKERPQIIYCETCYLSTGARGQN